MPPSSSGPGRSPFKAKTGVRISVGAQLRRQMFGHPFEAKIRSLLSGFCLFIIYLIRNFIFKSYCSSLQVEILTRTIYNLVKNLPRDSPNDRFQFFRQTEVDPRIRK